MPCWADVCSGRAVSSGWLRSLGPGRAGWRDLGEPERRHWTIALSLEGGGWGRKGTQGRRDSASKGTAAWGCRAGDSVGGDGTTVNAGPGRRNWAWQGLRQGLRKMKSRVVGWQPCVFQKEDTGISRKTLEGTYTSRSFQGAQGWVLLQLCIILLLASLLQEAAIILPALIPPSAA